VPAVSEKQKKFMQAVAHSPAFAKKVGVSQSVGREFSKAKGGAMKESKKMMRKEIAFMQKKGAPKSMIKHEKAEAKSMGYAKGGMRKKRAAAALGALAAMAARRGAPRTMGLGAPPAPPAGPMGMGMKKGGAKKGGMKKMASGGSYRRVADGVAKKGHTKGKQVAMRRGGMCD
jgi:hypothetical protein